MRNVIGFVLLWVGLIIQSTLFQVPPINVIQPNLVLVVLMCIAVTRGPRAALVLGVLIGFIEDADYGSFLGLNAFVYGVVGYFAAVILSQFLHKNIALTLLLSVVCTFGQEWITFGMTRLFGVTAYSWRSVMGLTIGQMIVNGITLLLLYPLLIRWLVTRHNSRYKHTDNEIL